MSKKINYEKEIVGLMIALYCRKKHRSKELCPACRELKEYAKERLTKCPFGDEKSACSHCKVHCYKPDMRERIREVMRFSGPRMLIYHPWAFVKHYARELSSVYARRRRAK